MRPHTLRRVGNEPESSQVHFLGPRWYLLVMKRLTRWKVLLTLGLFACGLMSVLGAIDGALPPWVQGIFAFATPCLTVFCAAVAVDRPETTQFTMDNDK